MGIIGKALGNYFRGVVGQFSVELPDQLRGEITDLVNSCNSGQSSVIAALFVTNQPQLAGASATTSWADLLSWRTGHDRVFSWIRGSGQPDSSFLSVVRKFIDDRFPGGNESILTVEQLCSIVLEEIWRQHGLSPNTPLFDKFLEVLGWVLDTARFAFERHGNGPRESWSDQFLVYCAQIVDSLDALVTSCQSAGSVSAQNSWDIFRLAGLPAPTRTSGNTNILSNPPELSEIMSGKDTISIWEQVFEDYILTPGGSTLFFSVLDRVHGGPTPNAWWGFNWPTVSTATRPILMLGQNVFLPVSTVAWSDITLADIKEAILQLGQPVPLRLNQCPQINTIVGQADSVILATRQGQVSHSHTAQKWRARVTLSGISLVYKADWSHLYLQATQPSNPQLGDAWVRPSDVIVEITLGNVRSHNVQSSVDPGDILHVDFDIEVEYPAERNQNNLEGRWKPNRRLKLTFPIRQWDGNSWSARREIRESIDTIIPSPFEVTLIAIDSKGKLALSPDRDDTFTNTPAPLSSWSAITSPDLQLPAHGTYHLTAYDGRLDPGQTSFLPASIRLSILSPQPTSIMSSATSTGYFSGSSFLDETDVFEADDGNNAWTITTVTVRERASIPSSGILAAIRNERSGHAQPSQDARNGLLGQYQDKLVEALKQASLGPLPNSLFQFVVPSGTMASSWPNHGGTPSPQFVGNSFPLPWIGNGPSQILTNTNEWREFNKSLQEILSTLGLHPQSIDVWISGLDPSRLDSNSVTRYVRVHKALILKARSLSPQDEFWAKYPLSVMAVEGESGAYQGQLLAILMSPLHPARIAWAFGVSRLGRSLGNSPNIVRRLLGILEGWNIPAVGFSIGPGQEPVPLVAVPLDPGSERDFVGWGGLAVLDRSGLPALPPLAVGLQLPWSGRTGINDHTVERALNDFLSAHPQSTSINVDLRSVSPSVRSRQVDESVLSTTAAMSGRSAAQLRGGTRVWDSKHRYGDPPSRDDLANIRSGLEIDTPFEWKRYDPAQQPETDLALIEDASVNLALPGGQQLGVTGPLPVRRFAPTTVHANGLDEHFAVQPGEDILGICELLEVLESAPDSTFRALRSGTISGALGLSGKSRWEILGTFHLDPVQLSQFVANLPSAFPRVLWEWHPSWLRGVVERDPDLGNRPYFVVARVPPSISDGLSVRHGLSSQQALELLGELGNKGIGLASLVAMEGTNETAALGFFSALRLLAPPSDVSNEPVWQSNISCAQNGSLSFAILPIDPLTSFIEALAGDSFLQRADLLFISICHSQDATSFCIFPVEVKYHGSPSNPSTFPVGSDPELGRARNQLRETKRIIEMIADNLNLPATPEDGYLRRVGLTALIELALSLSPIPVSSGEKSAIFKHILHGKTRIEVGQQLLTWFSVGATASGGAPCVSGIQTPTTSPSSIQELFIDPVRVPGLLWVGSNPSGDEVGVRTACDGAILACLSQCSLAEPVIPLNLGNELARILEQPSPASTRPVTAPAQALVDTEAQAPTQEQVSGQESPETEITEVVTETQTVEAPTETEEQAAREEGEAQLPGYLVGSSNYSARWTVIGNIAGTEDHVALDLDQPKGIGIFGYMGTGKSYLLGTLEEAAAMEIPGINIMPAPLATVIFNYRRNYRERFELSSLAYPNDNHDDVERLDREFGARPLAISDIHVLCLPGELNDEREEEYGGISASELRFGAADLDMEDWELLMGQPSSNQVYAQVIRQVLDELRQEGHVSIDMLSQRISHLSGTSRSAAQLRLNFARRYISKESATSFQDIVRPGRVLIVDLRKQMFDKDDALRFFLICANHISRIQAQFNTLIVFDEAHEYLSNMFAEKIETGMRYMRHRGATYVFATHDIRSIPQNVSRWIGTKFVFSLGSQQNVEDLVRFTPEFRYSDLINLQSGHCLVSSSNSLNGIFREPRLVRIRPRVTRHGGTTRIYSSGAQA